MTSERGWDLGEVAECAERWWSPRGAGGHRAQAWKGECTLVPGSFLLSQLLSHLPPPALPACCFCLGARKYSDREFTRREIHAGYGGSCL